MPGFSAELPWAAGTAGGAGPVSRRQPGGAGPGFPPLVYLPAGAGAAIHRQTAEPAGAASAAAAAAGPAAGTPPLRAPTGPEVEQMAQRVYEILVRRLASERERRGR